MKNFEKPRLYIKVRSKIAILITRLYINHRRRKTRSVTGSATYSGSGHLTTSKYAQILAESFWIWLISALLLKINSIGFSTAKNKSKLFPRPNVGSVINRNKNILWNYNKVKNSSLPSIYCNFENKANYSLKGKCCVSSVVYKVVLSTGNGEKVYHGSCSTTFKARYYNHTHSFRDHQKRNATELSKACGNARTTTKLYQCHGAS